MIKKFSKGQTVYDRSAQIWQLLTPWVTWKLQDDKLPLSKHMQGLITYGRLAEELGYSVQAGRTLAQPLYTIAIFCQQNGLPALNAIVVRKDTGLAGEGVVTSEYYHTEDEMAAVLDHNWLVYKSPAPRQFRKAMESHKKSIEDEF